MKSTVAAIAITLALGTTACTVAVAPPHPGMVLVEGRWVTPPRAGAVWVPGHWEHRTAFRRVWVAGHWRF